MTLIKLRNSDGAGLYQRFGFPSILNETLDKFWSEQANTWMPATNIKERQNDFLIELAAPGLDKKDFKISLEDNVLSISAEKKEELVEENEKYTRKEFFAGAFTRQFTLPDAVNHDDIQANYNNGILQLSIPKLQVHKQKTKEISIA